jgi:2-succinyl-5-enolpyruvyl-6-hydroxy-3-cyclohexene-1-carboxylate synthase
MVLDYRNTNTLWASVLVETLHCLGLQTAIVCPGSRSAPLAIAFAQHPAIEAIPILDERSAAFFALGRARQSRLPVALLCTSGTAGANFFPAVIEARESHVPLIVLTADRPPELRNCHAGQAINQIQLYGQYPTWQTELATPAAESSMLAYLRQTIVHAWERARWPSPGPVHLNIPFRDPLVPISEPISQQIDETHFFKAVRPSHLSLNANSVSGLGSLPLHVWQECDRGLIIAGPAIPAHPELYCQAVATLARHLGWPVLAEGLSPLRNYAELNPYLIATYDIALRNSDLQVDLEPDIILQLGELPTSKALRQWLEPLKAQHWILEPSVDNVDSLHRSSTHLRLSVETLAAHLKHSVAQSKQSTPYLKAWLTSEIHLRLAIQALMQSTIDMRESKVAWVLSQYLPEGTSLFVANSMPIRDVEVFWQPGESQICPYFNRGANGIDGTLSTALGLSHRQQSTVLLTGDLAFLHDTNGFLSRTHWRGHLTIVLINNNGGGIFNMLPIAQFDPPFETFFATPQQVNFATLCESYGVAHEVISSWDRLQDCLQDVSGEGIRVLEIQCDRTIDADWRRSILHSLSTMDPNAAR